MRRKATGLVRDRHPLAPPINGDGPSFGYRNSFSFQCSIKEDSPIHLMGRTAMGLAGRPGRRLAIKGKRSAAVLQRAPPAVRHSGRYSRGYSTARPSISIKFAQMYSQTFVAHRLQTAKRNWRHTERQPAMGTTYESVAQQNAFVAPETGIHRTAVVTQQSSTCTLEKRRN